MSYRGVRTCRSDAGHSIGCWTNRLLALKQGRSSHAPVFEFKIYKGQKHDKMTWPIFSLLAIGCCPGNRVIPKRASATGLVFNCQVQQNAQRLLVIPIFGSFLTARCSKNEISL